MTTGNARGIGLPLRTLFQLGTIRDLTDGQLLERFTTGQGEAAELAFAALVERHSALVLRVCRSRLIDPADTHDAFQVTFLVLLKKAKQLWVRDSLAPWLHQVAFRTASCARADALRRRRHEERFAGLSENRREFAELDDSAFDSGRETILHEEINRLPERFRQSIVLCDLQGFTCEEAARRMGRSIGTVKAWRFRARERLRQRLNQRGETFRTELGLVIAGKFSGHAPSIHETMRLANTILQRGAGAGIVSASTHILFKGVLKMLLIDRARHLAFGLLAAAILTTGLGTLAVSFADKPEPPKAASAEVAPQTKVADPPRRAPRPTDYFDATTTWPLTLHDATLIGMGNAEGYRVVSITDGGIVCKVVPTKAPVDVRQTEIEMMAEVRSIAQTYHALGYQYARLWGQETVLKVIEDAVRAQEGRFASGGKQDTKGVLINAEQRLENAKLNLVTCTSDVITTERQLRKLLGLPPADHRRIVPSTPPIEAHIVPDWDDTLGESKANGNNAKANANDLEHQVARFFVDLESCYKQFQTASNDLAKARENLDRDRDRWADDQIPLDNYIDRLNIYAGSIALEAEKKACYNTAIVALEEAKGTLLDSNRITLVKPGTTKAGPTPFRR